MEQLINILSFAALAVLAFPFASVLLSLVFKRKSINDNSSKRVNDFGIIITAYKNYEIALPLVDSLVKQAYNKNRYSIYLVADACGDVAKIEDERYTSVYVLVPEKNLSSKIKSIEYAVDGFMRKHNYVVIMDADNIAHPGFLAELNKKINEGYKAVQGKRTHKNLDTVYSCLDAAGETYYNYTQRTVPFSLGSSAAIAGSAMAVRIDLFKEYLETTKQNNGLIIAEDKMLQNFLANRNTQICFAEEAVVYDEKISKGSQAQRQRTRWLNSYFKNLKESSALIFSGIAERNFNKLYFGLMTAYPPIITLIIGSFLLVLTSILLGTNSWTTIFAGWFVFVANFALALKLQKADAKIWKSLLFIPLFATRQILALFNLKKSNKDFLATEHSQVVTINQILEGSSL